VKIELKEISTKVVFTIPDEKTLTSVPMNPEINIFTKSWVPRFTNYNFRFSSFYWGLFMFIYWN